MPANMEDLALEISFYFFVLIFLFGMGLFIVLLYWFFVQRRDPLNTYPQAKKLSIIALTEVQSLCKQMQNKQETVASEEQARFLEDVSAAQTLFRDVKQQTQQLHQPYQRACSLREAAWEHLSEVVQQMPFYRRWWSRYWNSEYQELVSIYQQQSYESEQLYERMVQQDRALLKRLKKHRLFQDYEHLLSKLW